MRNQRVTEAGMRVRRILGLAALVALAACRIHETSAAEAGVPGQYYVTWVEAGKVVEFTMLLEPAGQNKLTGRYLGSVNGTDASGSVSGTYGDSVKLVFNDGAASGSFSGLDISGDGLEGNLRFRVASIGYLTRQTFLQKKKIEYSRRPAFTR